MQRTECPRFKVPNTKNSKFQKYKVLLAGKDENEPIVRIPRAVWPAIVRVEPQPVATPRHTEDDREDSAAANRIHANGFPLTQQLIFVLQTVINWVQCQADRVQAQELVRVRRLGLW